MILSSDLLPGQPCNKRIEGEILSDEGKFLPQATVKIVNTEQTVLTADDGSFIFDHLCQDRVQILVSYVGFSNITITLDLPIKRKINIILQRAQKVLDDVIVEGEQLRRGASQTSAILSREDLAGLHGKPLGESLKEIPGVNALQTGPAIFKPVIHGLHSQRIMVLNNGIRQEGQQWGVEHAPEIDPFIASEIEVVKGSETVRYGSDAIGGVIIVNPPALHPTEKIGGEFNVGLVSNNRMGVFSGMMEGGIKPWRHCSWRVQGSFKKGGDYHTPDYNLSNTGIEEYNFSAALGFEHDHHGGEIYISSFNTAIGILRAAHTGNNEDLQRSIVSERPWYIKDFTYDINNPRQNIRHYLVKVKAYEQIRNLGRLNIQYGGQFNQREEFDIRRGDNNTRPALSLGLFSNVVDVTLDHEKGHHSGSIGINGTLKSNKNDTQETGIVALIPDYNQLASGIFVFEKLKFNKWVLEAGGRYDYQHLLVKTFQNRTLLKPEFNFHYFSGNLGATYNWTPSWRIIVNAGYSTRPPHVSELYSEGLHHGTASIEEGLMLKEGVKITDHSHVKEEISKKIIGTLQHTKENLSLDFSLYYNDIDNYVYLRPYETRLTNRGNFPAFQYRQNNAVLTGSDVSLKYTFSEKITYKLKGSYLYAKDRDNDDVLPFIPPAQIENGVSFNVNSNRIKDLIISVNLPYTFKQIRAPKVVYPLDLDSETVQGKNFDFAPAPAGYLLVNASVSFKIPVKENTLTFSLSTENVFNEVYRNYMNRLRYYSDEIGRNFSLRLSYNFLQH
ncbi:TonB-dependent receptor [Chryseosolibacter indicus]|uniref:TonB-dependent receptor n=1 Tax=Chryseosolibacter indicus TaxID=2782351 RepID=UPI0020B31C6E|nr:TonB-dependent receptor [Chryseosolibacter indicus]